MCGQIYTNSSRLFIRNCIVLTGDKVILGEGTLGFGKERSLENLDGRVTWRLETLADVQADKVLLFVVQVVNGVAEIFFKMHKTWYNSTSSYLCVNNNEKGWTRQKDLLWTI